MEIVTEKWRIVPDIFAINLRKRQLDASGRFTGKIDSELLQTYLPTPLFAKLQFDLRAKANFRTQLHWRDVGEERAATLVAGAKLDTQKPIPVGRYHVFVDESTLKFSAQKIRLGMRGDTPWLENGEVLGSWSWGDYLSLDSFSGRLFRFPLSLKREKDRLVGALDLQARPFVGDVDGYVRANS